MARPHSIPSDADPGYGALNDAIEKRFKDEDRARMAYLTEVCRKEREALRAEAEQKRKARAERKAKYQQMYHAMRKKAANEVREKQVGVQTPTNGSVTPVVPALQKCG